MGLPRSCIRMIVLCISPAGVVSGLVACCLAVLLCLPTLGAGQPGTISFAQQQLVVDEGSAMFTPVQIPLDRVGGTTGAIVVSIEASRHNPPQ